MEIDDTIWKPRGFTILHVVYMLFPYGIHVEARPIAVHMETMWFTCGLHVFPYGFHVDKSVSMLGRLKISLAHALSLYFSLSSGGGV